MSSPDPPSDDMEQEETSTRKRRHSDRRRISTQRWKDAMDNIAEDRAAKAARRAKATEQRKIRAQHEAAAATVVRASDTDEVQQLKELLHKLQSTLSATEEELSTARAQIEENNCADSDVEERSIPRPVRMDSISTRLLRRYMDLEGAEHQSEWINIRATVRRFLQVGRIEWSRGWKEQGSLKLGKIYDAIEAENAFSNHKTYEVCKNDGSKYRGKVKRIRGQAAAHRKSARSTSTRRIRDTSSEPESDDADSDELAHCQWDFGLGPGSDGADLRHERGTSPEFGLDGADSDEAARRKRDTSLEFGLDGEDLDEFARRRNTSLELGLDGADPDEPARRISTRRKPDTNLEPGPDDVASDEPARRKSARHMSTRRKQDTNLEPGPDAAPSPPNDTWRSKKHDLMFSPPPLPHADKDAIPLSGLSVLASSMNYELPSISTVLIPLHRYPNRRNPKGPFVAGNVHGHTTGTKSPNPSCPITPLAEPAPCPVSPVNPVHQEEDVSAGWDPV
ncbi:hypothetical protein BD779DRAFT_1676565 [Infundibulicybe gibba]|nr:hypothetical protein BD779DRAFT_1676565 [Infundibulicybe gibba]